MLNLMVVSHGDLAFEMVKSAKMIIGDSASLIRTHGLHESDSTDTLTDNIFSDVKELLESGELIIFCDLKGGSPMISSARAINQLPEIDRSKVAIVSGVNLPMLLEVAVRNSFEEMNLQDAARLAKTIGSEGIVVLSERKEVQV